MMTKAINDEAFSWREGLLESKDGVYLLPANLDLSAMEMNLVSTMNRERVLKGYVDKVKKNFDFVIIDCMSSLGMITVNALSAATLSLFPCSLIICQLKAWSSFLRQSARCRSMLTISKGRRRAVTLVDARTTFASEVPEMIRQIYPRLRIFNNQIPMRIKAGRDFCNGREHLSI